MNVILFWGNLITKGGALGYVRSIELSAPFLHPLFSFSPTPSLAPPSISIPWILLNSNCLAGALFTNAWRWAVARLLLYPLLHLTQSKIHLISFSQVSADRLMYHYAMEQVPTFNVEACHSLFARSWIFYQVSSCFFVFVFDSLVSKCCPRRGVRKPKRGD